LTNQTRQVEHGRRKKFPVRARLLKPVEFKMVFRNSVVSADRCFKVLARSNENGYSRLGMAVSRQVDRHAVGRNRIKRVIRESFRRSFEAVAPVSAESGVRDEAGHGSISEENSVANCRGIDLVVLPRREAAALCNRELFHSLDAHWSRLRRKTGLKQETR